MTKVEHILFIDANLYLDLYETVTGQLMLATLEEQQERIFVTHQVADEVQRNKVKVAARFLKSQFEKLKQPDFAVPDHFFGKADDRVIQIRDALKESKSQIDIVSEQWMNLAHDLLGQISRSEDEVSRSLKGLFEKAVLHTDDELSRAKIRKDLGRAPGKNKDPIGDELSWEQIVSRCQSKTKLWIIARDKDYAVEHKGKMFLNASLYQELANLCGPEPEVFCFKNIPDGIKHFAALTKVKADKLPTAAETEQIKREQESLPPFDWYSGLDDAAWVVLLNQQMRKKASAALFATQINPPLGEEFPSPS